MDGICVFAASSMPRNRELIEAAERLGAYIAQRGHLFVYGGSQLGLMGVSRDAAKNAGGRVTGVIIEMFKRFATIDDVVVSDFPERLAKMRELSKGVVCLAGGIGTFYEKSDVLQGAQLKRHQLPTVVINTAGYYDGFITQFQRGIDEGLIPPDNGSFLHVVVRPEESVDFIESYVPRTIKDKV